MTYYPLDKVTRIEIIDQDGRSYVNWDETNKVELSFQDDKRTLKVFISRVNPDEREPHSLITKTLKNHYDELENQKMSSYRAEQVWEAFKSELIDNGLKDSEDVRQGLSTAIKKVVIEVVLPYMQYTEWKIVHKIMEDIRKVVDELDDL